jgi:aldehyde:ferredoxin oxidoreductase
VGEGVSTLARWFNVREGFGRAQDTLPRRVLAEPLASGPARGQTVELDGMLDAYYTLMGWDPQTGNPTEATLLELGLEWTI